MSRSPSPPRSSEPSQVDAVEKAATSKVSGAAVHLYGAAGDLAADQQLKVADTAGAGDIERGADRVGQRRPQLHRSAIVIDRAELCAWSWRCPGTTGRRSLISMLPVLTKPPVSILKTPPGAMYGDRALTGDELAPGQAAVGGAAAEFDQQVRPQRERVAAELLGEFGAVVDGHHGVVQRVGVDEKSGPPCCRSARQHRAGRHLGRAGLGHSAQWPPHCRRSCRACPAQ